MEKEPITKEVNEKFQTLLCCILSSLLAGGVLLIALWLIGTFPGRKNTLIYGDGFFQAFCFSKMFWRHLLFGESLSWSFELGMGMPSIAVYAFYALSPFQIFTVLVSDMELASLFILSGKAMASAVCMSLFLRRGLGCGKSSTVLMAVSYSLCAFFSTFYVAYYFMDMLWLFPLLILALKHFVDSGKWGFLCIIYAVSFVLQFYCAYIMGILSVVFLIAYGIYHYGRQGKLWKTCLLRYCLCVLIAILLSTPLTLPTAMELFSYRASDSLLFTAHVLYPWDFLAGLFPGQGIGIYNSKPLMYAGIPALLLTVTFLLSKDVEGKKKLVVLVPLLFLVTASFIDPLYRLMHAFDAPNGYYYRFSWGVSFLLTTVAAWMLEHRQEGSGFTKNYIISGISVIVVYVVLLFIQQIAVTEEERTLDIEGLLIFLLLVLLYSIFILRMGKSLAAKVFVGALLCAELIMDILDTHINETLLMEDRYVQVRQEQADSMMRYVEAQEEEDEHPFYRIHYLNSYTDNVSALYGYNGLGIFSSVENEKVRNVLNKCGYATSPLATFDYGSTKLMQMLFSQQYDFECGFPSENMMEQCHIEKNACVLPLGYMISLDVKDCQLGSADPFENMNELVSVMSGRQWEVFHWHNSGVRLDMQGMEQLYLEDGIRVQKTVEDSEIATGMFSFEAEREDAAYAYLSRWGYSANDQSMEIPYIYSDRDLGIGHASAVVMPHILPLGCDEDNICRLYLLMRDNSERSFDYEGLYIAYEDEEELKNLYDELIPGGMEVMDFAHDRISASVEVSAERPVLFTSIPWDCGWEVWVDGVKTDTIKLINDAFLGVELTEGKHELLFCYRSKAAKLSGILWILGIAVLGVYHLKQFKRKDKVM